jgi:hypothetical protein
VLFLEDDGRVTTENSSLVALSTITNYKPKDIPLAENAVKLAYQRISALLHEKYFNHLSSSTTPSPNCSRFTIPGKLTKLDIYRRELFEEIEADSLKTLPTENYPMKYFENHKVAPAYHSILSKDRHCYSAPWQLKGQLVKVNFDERNVAEYHNNCPSP